MPRFISDFDEDALIDFEFLDGGEDEAMIAILMEEFGFPEDEDEENEDAFLDEELDDYGEEW